MSVPSQFYVYIYVFACAVLDPNGEQIKYNTWHVLIHAVQVSIVS